MVNHDGISESVTKRDIVARVSVTKRDKANSFNRDRM